MKRIFVFFALVTFMGASAQTTGDLLLFSKSNFGIATARSAAMGGAFTSLGADLSTMSINPAGLGLYRSGEVGISPQLRFENTVVGYSQDPFSSKNSATTRDNTTNKMAVGSLGGVAVIRNLNLGFGYNRLADYYSNSYSVGTDQELSITDMFAAQLFGISSEKINTQNPYDAYYSYPPVLWGAISAYQAYAVDNIKDGPLDEYRSMLADYSIVAPVLVRKTEGALDEFTFSASYNVKDIVYFGATLGVQALKYRKFDTYSEVSSDEGYDFLSDLAHKRTLDLSGTGSNIKLGVIVRPLEWFRVGVSYHSPTWMNVNEESDEIVYTKFFDSNDDKNIYADTPILTNNYDVSTPGRLLVGASATIASRAIVSVDYKVTWFNQMAFANKFRERDYRPEITANRVDNYEAVNDVMSRPGAMIDMNRIVTNNYVPVNNYSIGIEGNLGAGIFIRGGYMYQDSPYKATEYKDYETINQYSAGLGFRTRNISLDLTYVNSTTTLMPYKYYSYLDYESQGWVTSKQVVQNVILSVGFRF